MSPHAPQNALHHVLDAPCETRLFFGPDFACEGSVSGSCGHVCHAFQQRAPTVPPQSRLRAPRPSPPQPGVVNGKEGARSPPPHLKAMAQMWQPVDLLTPNPIFCRARKRKTKPHPYSIVSAGSGVHSMECSVTRSLFTETIKKRPENTVKRHSWW